MTAMLNNDIRPQIVRAVISHAYRPRLEVMNARATELLQMLVIREVGQSNFNMMTALHAACPDAINRISSGHVTINGQQHYIGGWESGYQSAYFVGLIPCSAEYVLSHNRRAPHPTFEQIDPDASSDLAKMVERYSNDRIALTDEGKKRKAEVTAILNSCRTFDQLAVAWPDVMPIADGFRPTPKAKPQALALVPKDLSLSLGLPPEERIAA